jgi:hypothetical protein
MVLTDDAVPEPVGGGGDGDALGADGKLEDLTDDDPACGTPGAGNVSVRGYRLFVDGMGTYDAKKKMNRQTKTIKT